MKRLLILVPILLVSVTFLSFSQDSEADEIVDESMLTVTTNVDDGDEGSLSVFSAWDFIRMALILGAVVAVIYGVFFLLKRTGNPKLQENRLIKVLSSKTLVGSRALHLVEIGNQIFLVGTSENAVNLVSEIEDKETLDGLRLQAESVAQTERRNFSDVLTQVFGKQSNQIKPQSVDPTAFLRNQRQRVKNM